MLRDIQGGAEKVRVQVKNKINQKWLVEIDKTAGNKVKPKFTNNQLVAILFSDLDAAIKAVSNLSDYGITEWAFYENGKLTEVIK